MTVVCLFLTSISSREIGMFFNVNTPTTTTWHDTRALGLDRKTKYTALTYKRHRSITCVERQAADAVLLAGSLPRKRGTSQ